VGNERMLPDMLRFCGGSGHVSGTVRRPRLAGRGAEGKAARARPVRAGNEHPVDYTAVELDRGSQVGVHFMDIEPMGRKRLLKYIMDEQQPLKDKKEEEKRDLRVWFCLN